jgi:hypothetical protein
LLAEADEVIEGRASFFASPPTKEIDSADDFTSCYERFPATVDRHGFGDQVTGAPPTS